MPTSQNGYPANDPRLVSSRRVPGTTRNLTVRIGPSGDLLLWVAGQFDDLVEDIEQGILDDWGYAPRTIRGSTTTLSNHASGTAVDLNATAHPLGTDPHRNFTQQEIDRIHAILARTEGCVRWGGDYTGRRDGMHFEINDGVSEARCAAVLKKINSQGDWIDMATKDEVTAAVHDGNLQALKDFFWFPYTDPATGKPGRSSVNDWQQQTGSQIDMQTKLEATNKKLDALNNKFDDLISAVKALKA
ncbi:M15 family metallopeptidase [Amycolatopsis sp. NPDC051128]|uniref:M15 family metallopeptidase n=1 Tax=Amycolatopsis sp. NPDC051128 TaxID=3155412 RepID=UPI00343EBA0E